MKNATVSTMPSHQLSKHLFVFFMYKKNINLDFIHIGFESKIESVNNLSPSNYDEEERYNCIRLFLSIISVWLANTSDHATDYLPMN